MRNSLPKIIFHIWIINYRLCTTNLDPFLRWHIWPAFVYAINAAAKCVYIITNYGWWSINLIYELCCKESKQKPPNCVPCSEVAKILLGKIHWKKFLAGYILLFCTIICKWNSSHQKYCFSPSKLITNRNCTHLYWKVIHLTFKISL